MQKICKVCNTLKEFGTSARTMTCTDCIEDGYKYCTTCGKVKATHDFRSVNNKPKSKCRECEREYNAIKSKELYDRSPERRQAIKEACRKSRSTGAGWLRANAYASKYYSTPEGKQQNREASQRWYSTPEGRLYAKNKSHNRRLVTDAGDVSIGQWQEALEFFDYRCAYCSAEAELTLDHVVAISKGGQHNILNIVPACKHCNSSKGANDMEEWYRSRSYFTEACLQRIIHWGLLDGKV